MSLIKKQFYNFFWQNKACQNLFLLSKEELLDTRTVDTGSGLVSYTNPRIIISNVESDDFKVNTIKIRNENNSMHAEEIIKSKVDYFKSVLENFITPGFQKSLDMLFEDIENKPVRFIFSIIRTLADEKRREERIIELLKKYNFVGNHIKGLNQIESLLEKKFLSKKNNELLNEESILKLTEGVKYLKDFYLSYNYQVLYTSNQILVNALSSEDDFESRIKLFQMLYESKIIYPNGDDSFMDCANCEPNTFTGNIKLNLGPKKLENLKCPSCLNEVNYHVPYKLHEDIYQIIQSKDGLILDCLNDLLSKNNIKYRNNIKLLNDIEIDCGFSIGDVDYMIEAKMYKISTNPEKLKSKMREHFGKLKKDVSRIKEIKKFEKAIVKPILLVNIIDNDLISNLEIELKTNNTDFISNSIEIKNITDMMRLFPEGNI